MKKVTDPIVAATRVGQAFRNLDHQLDAVSGKGDVAQLTKVLTAAGGRRVAVKVTPQQWTVSGQPLAYVIDDYISAAINPKNGRTYLGGFDRGGLPVLFEMPHASNATVIAPDADQAEIKAALLRGLHT
jgi:hypothetical protein